MVDCLQKIGKVYEVDMIMGDKMMKHEKHYFVKWKDFSTKHNTWEPVDHLKGSQDMINFYEAMKSSEPTDLDPNLIKYFVNDISKRKPYDVLTWIKLCSLITSSSEESVKNLQLTTKDLRMKVKEIAEYRSSKLSKISDKLFKIMKFSAKRRKVLISLEEWESNINSLHSSMYIKVENDVDLEGPPPGFQFIRDYVNNIGISVPEDPVTFCDCDNCYENKVLCCPEDSDSRFAYDKSRRLILPPGYPIYECNDGCKCGSDCINRVVQNGRKIKVAIFRTPDGRGWGLKTLDFIDKGEFVLEYLGEIITSEEAETRGTIYDYLQRSYLFDLDYGVDKCCFTVDAKHMGNVSHFINHSCDPNLHVYAVWINQPSPYLPRLAFFAKRKIKRGEELTFDYKIVNKYDWSSSPVSETKRIRCKCKARSCRKFLF